MLLGCIADDFTGASDLANVLTRNGLRTVQFNGVPAMAAAAADAGIVALKTRSIAAADAVAQSLAALHWLEAQGCNQFLFKYCSTFDSTPDGNIGPVAAALLDALDVPGAIVCPAYPTLGRTIYRGHLFVGDRLLNESGLERHPLNPMTDSDLVRWLGYQTKLTVGALSMDVVAKGAAAARRAIDGAIAQGRRLLVCDCIDDGDLLVLGEAVADMRLVTGGSGIALGLAANFRKRGGLASGTAPPLAFPSGRSLALAGSCSMATREQIAVHARRHPVVQVRVDDILAQRASIPALLSWSAENADRGVPLIYSSADPEEVVRAQAAHGAAAVSSAVEAFFGTLARDAVASGVRRLIVAGGETSSAVVAALDVAAMRVGPEIDPGVPALLAEGEPPLALALKSGNFGAPDFFAKCLMTFDGSSDGR